MSSVCLILEYCCVVWHYAISCYLSEQLKRVQIQDFGVIFPKQTHSRVYELTDCPRLDVCRNDLFIGTLKKIDGKGLLSKHLTIGSLRSRRAGRLRTAEWWKNVAGDSAFPILFDIFSSSCCVSYQLMSVSTHGSLMRNSTRRNLYKCRTEQLKRIFFHSAITSFYNNI